MVVGVGNSPDQVERLERFGLNGAEQVGAELVEQPAHQEVQILVQVVLVRLDQQRQRVQEEAEHLRTVVGFCLFVFLNHYYHYLVAR